MNIHEFQAKELLKQYKVPVPSGGVAGTPEDADSVVRQLKGTKFVVKAQIHAGGRGKAGGVKLGTADEVKSLASQILGKTLVTHQTGPEGKKVHMVWIEEATNIAKEYYLGVVMDRTSQSICIMASSEGGMEIEEVAHKTPEKIHKVFVTPQTGLMPAHIRRLAYGLNLDAGLHKGFSQFVNSLYKLFVDKDCSIAEINPLVLTKENTWMALDCKLNFDDNALFRHEEIVAFRDTREENPAELEASKYDLSYVSLEGNIGCMVNGAGLAMSTMDIIKLEGGQPANFLDVGGGASKEKVTAALKIILKDPSVKAILINIFGGIMKCDTIAEGVIAGAKEVGLKLPLVVRLEGTNVKEGKELLSKSGLNLISANDLEDAAKKVVATLKGAK